MMIVSLSHQNVLDEKIHSAGNQQHGDDNIILFSDNIHFPYTSVRKMRNQELNDIVCRHELILEQLRRDFATLKEQLLAMSPSISGDTSQDEPPPHY